MLGHPRDEDWDSFLAQTGTVISAGIKSAAKTLQILTTEYSILGKLQLAIVFYAPDTLTHLG